MIVLLPILVLFLSTCCDYTGYPSQTFKDDWKNALLSKFTIDFLYQLFDPSAFLVYIGYVATLAFFYMVLPGKNASGATLRDGSVIRYRINGKKKIIRLLTIEFSDKCIIGFTSFIALLCVAIYFLRGSGVKPLEYVYNHFVGLTFASIVFSYAVSLAVYIGSFEKNKLLALGGNSGNPIYDVRIISLNYFPCLTLI